MEDKKFFDEVDALSKQKKSVLVIGKRREPICESVARPKTIEQIRAEDDSKKAFSISPQYSPKTSFNRRYQHPVINTDNDIILVINKKGVIVNEKRKIAKQKGLKEVVVGTKGNE